jgi:hypothetical protein
MKPWDRWVYDYETADQMQIMIHAWVGRGQIPVTDSFEQVTRVCGVGSYIQDMVLLITMMGDSATEERIGTMISQPDCLAADLHSAFDAIMIKGFATPSEPSRPLRVVEVGGGFGRLVEALRYIASLQVEYVLVDAVPGSMMFAYLYLRKHYPELRIGLSYAGDVYAAGQWDVFIMSSWQVQQLPDGYFDLAINIDSFQEMNQGHVDFFLGLFDRLLRDQGMVYVSNSRDYRFTGAFNFPAHWDCRYMRRSPRSWTRNHPTEIFFKTKRDCSAIYKLQLMAFMTDLQHTEIVHAKELDIRATLPPVISFASLECHLRWPGPQDRGAEGFERNYPRNQSVEADDQLAKIA